MAYPLSFRKGDDERVAHNASERVRLEWDGYALVQPEVDENVADVNKAADEGADADKAAADEAAAKQAEEDEKAQLQHELKDAGVDVDGRWGVARLREEVAKAKGVDSPETDPNA